MNSRLRTATAIVSLLVLAITGFAVFNLFSFSSRLKEKVEIIAYLRDSADTIALQNEIVRIGEVKKVKFISKEEALGAFKKDMGKDAEIFSVLKTNPLPNSLRIRIKAAFVTAGEFKKISEKLKDLPGIDEVRYENEFLTRLLQILKIAELVGLIGGGIITGYSILVLSATRQVKMTL